MCEKAVSPQVVMMHVPWERARLARRRVASIKAFKDSHVASHPGRFAVSIAWLFHQYERIPAGRVPVDALSLKYLDASRNF